jgi:hypothetical protein
MAATGKTAANSEWRVANLVALPNWRVANLVALPNCCVEVVFVQAEGQSALTDGGHSRWHS